MGLEVTVGVQLSAWSPKLLGAFHKLPWLRLRGAHSSVSQSFLK